MKFLVRVGRESLKNSVSHVHCFPFVLLRVILLFKAPLTIYLPELTEIISYINLKNNSPIKALFSVFCVNIWDVDSNLRISLRYVSGESWFLSAHFCVQMEGLLHPVQRSRHSFTVKLTILTLVALNFNAYRPSIYHEAAL